MLESARAIGCARTPALREADAPATIACQCQVALRTGLFQCFVAFSELRLDRARCSWNELGHTVTKTDPASLTITGSNRNVTSNAASIKGSCGDAGPLLQ
jgi:hypothetical protein